MSGSDPIGDEGLTESGAAFIVVMGVSGTGKSTLGTELARALKMPYVEGDDLHPQANVDKMAAGTPLDDADREPWLELIRTTAEKKVVEEQAAYYAGKRAHHSAPRCHGVVITCSALKKYYRDILRGILKPASKDAQTLPSHLEAPSPVALPTYFVFIDGSRELLMERMKKRTGHFMKASMLDSQLSTLESPVGEDGVVVVSIQDLTHSTRDQIKMAMEGLVQVAYPQFSTYVKKLIEEEEGRDGGH
ncbi:gluconokinase [Pholiota conissans]|uniref:Gluconokinase n=1 Tax=Pholiota conissans TaxID=109636 RepID=A0A9P5Z1K9_9AGAR|nr:gluconokinase [Pholiota conissans]